MLFRFWRWVTCGHGRHAWRIQAGLDLATHDDVTYVIAVYTCRRCGLVEVLE